MTGAARDKEGRRSQFLKGFAELALMALLERGPRYGLDILDGLREAGVDVADGTIYPMLHRLERSKLAKAEWRIEQGGARPRKYYALTAAGRTELEAQRRDWRQLSGALNKLLK